MISLSQQPHSNLLSSFPPKDIFTLYQTQHTIGKGTFSKVKLGYNKQTHQKVAIKILDKSKITTKSDIERINREITFLKKLKHINIVKIYEIKETLNNYYIFMEYCDKGELFHYIVSKHRIEENEASYFFYQLINGLEYIHANNIVHRDLKPENLLLCKGDILKIIDFGLSNYYNGRLLKTPCGSPCYASPEMLSGQKYNGYCIDIWSTGIILYAMVCGYLPFEDKDNESLFRKIMKGDLRFPMYISECVKDLIKKILVIDPNKRIKLEEIKQHLFYMKGKDLFMRNHPEIGNVNLGLCISSLSNKVSVGKSIGMIGMKHEEKYIKKGIVKKNGNEVKVGIVNRNNKSNSYKRSTTVNHNNNISHHHYGTNINYSPIETEIGMNVNNSNKYNIKVDNYLTTAPNTATRPSTTRTSLNINYDNLNISKPMIYNKTKNIAFNYHKTPKKENKIYKPPIQHHIPTNTEINNTSGNVNNTNNKTTSYINNNFLTNRKLDNYLLFPSQAYKKKQTCKHSLGDSDIQTSGNCLTELSTSHQQSNKTKFSSQIQTFRESSIKTKQNFHINTSNNSNINSISSISDNRTILNYNYINKESLSSKLSINNKTFTHNSINPRFSTIKNESNNSIVFNNPVIHFNMIEPKVFVNQRNSKRNNNMNYNSSTQNSLKSDPIDKMNDNNNNHLKINTNVNYDGNILNNNLKRRINFLNANIEKFNRKNTLTNPNNSNNNKTSNTINAKTNKQIISKKVWNTKNLEINLLNENKIRSVSAKENETNNNNMNNNAYINNVGINNITGRKSFTSSFVDKANINQGFVNLLTQLNNQLKNMKV